MIGDQALPTALVAGATGLIGRRLVRLLIESDDYDRVHLLVRRPTGITDDRLVEHAIDFDKLPDAGEDVGSVDHAFCALGTTIRTAGSREAFRRVDHDYVVAFAKLARDLGAQQFAVVSSLGADPDTRSFYLRVKGETERDLEALGLPRLVILRPSLLTGDRDEFRPGEKVSQLLLGITSPLLVGRLGRIRPVSDEQVARAMLGSVKNEGSAVRVIESEDIRSV
ncbi:MAG: oxidoreductase [Gammaproteobacteria bacterium]|nr:MAG: oxidoreductase [Gammaproteobacteria bacterium]